jgi:hypothetical protein
MLDDSKLKYEEDSTMVSQCNFDESRSILNLLDMTNLPHSDTEDEE